MATLLPARNDAWYDQLPARLGENRARQVVPALAPICDA